MKFAGLSINTPPAAEPVTAAEAITHLREPDSAASTYITTLITVARQKLENELGRALINQTWDMALDGFPEDGCPIILPVAPLSSVSSITYKDTDGTTQTWSSSNYIVDTVSDPGRIGLAYGVTYPLTYDEIKAVTVRFVAGYGTGGSSVPEVLKHALLLYLAYLYENREPVVTGTIATALPDHIDAMIAPYKVWLF